MKKLISIISITSLVVVLAQKANAQTAGRTLPKWISTKGYWVVEGNIRAKKENTICFYTNENQLVYKESISGTKVKLQKKKVKMQLKEVLEKSINEWANNKIATENKDYVKAILH